MISIKCFINSFEPAVISLSCSNFSMKPSLLWLVLPSHLVVLLVEGFCSLSLFVYPL